MLEQGCRVSVESMQVSLESIFPLEQSQNANNCQALMEVSNMTIICHMQAGESECGAPAAMHSQELARPPAPFQRHYCRRLSQTAATAGGWPGVVASYHDRAQDLA
jgi:hypothetical protein